MYVRNFSQQPPAVGLRQQAPNKGDSMSMYQDWLDFNQAYVQLEQIRILINKLPSNLESKISENEEMDLFTLTTVANRLSAVFQDRVNEVSIQIQQENNNAYTN